MHNKDFLDSKLFTAMNYIYWILLSSALFLLTNVLFIFVFFVMLQAIDQKLLPIHIIFGALVVAAIPMGPSFAALYRVMWKIIKEKDVSILSDFFKGYRENFKQAIVAWIIILIFLSLFAVNYYIMTAQNWASFLILPFFILISLLICATFYLFPLISIYEIKLKDAFKLGFYFTLKKFNLTIILLVLFVIAGYLFILFPTVLIIVLPGFLAFIVMFLCANPIQVVQAKVKVGINDETNH